MFVGENAGGRAPLPAPSDSAVKFSIGNSDLNNSRGDNIQFIEEEKQEELETRDQEELSSQKQKIKNFASQAVRFVEPVVHSLEDNETKIFVSSMQPLIDVTAKLDSGTYTVTQLPEYSVSDGGSGDFGLIPDEMESNFSTESSMQTATMPSSTVTGSRLSKLRSSLASQPLNINTSLAATPFTPCSMPQSSACFTNPNPEAIPLSAARDLSSMFNPLRGEYTSITDTIDTSCIEELSPPRSPVTASVMMFSESYLEVDVKAKERSAANSKQLELKEAEEMEHQRMETLIRHRLRQISQVQKIFSALCSCRVSG